MHIKESKTSRPNVLAIIVTYNPETQSLKKTIKSLHNQVKKILLIDNNSQKCILEKIEKFEDEYQIEITRCSENIGLAAAQNIGISQAMLIGYEYVLLLDQDSEPEENFTKKLISVFQSKQTQLISAVGPSIVDRRNSQVSKELSSENNTPETELLEKDFIISSGSLIKTEVFERIGGMNEALFIDHVDHDWCFRARSLGYKIYQNNEAKLLHTLGDKVIKLRFIRQRHISIHPPLRNYYQIRNSIFLAKQKYVPICRKFFFIIQSLIGALFGFAHPKPFIRAKYLMLGIYDGISGILGKFRR